MHEVDQNQNGIIETEEFLQVKRTFLFCFSLYNSSIFFKLMSAINTGAVSTSHFIKAARIGKMKGSTSGVERSGGGV